MDQEIGWDTELSWSWNRGEKSLLLNINRGFQNRLWPSCLQAPPHLKTEIDPVSETTRSLEYRIMDKVQNPITSNSSMYIRRIVKTPKNECTIKNWGGL
jgi:hypothetical protein